MAKFTLILRRTLPALLGLVLSDWLRAANLDSLRFTETDASALTPA